MFLIGTATTVEEALVLEESGVDAVVAQGSEAGGHRGTFQGDCIRHVRRIWCTHVRHVSANRPARRRFGGDSSPRMIAFQRGWSSERTAAIPDGASANRKLSETLMVG
jgi:hypothetical protein